MVDSLRDCPDWGQDELPIEIIRTHISVVLLGNHRVLKLKKPVDLGFLDYTTLEKRREANIDRTIAADSYESIRDWVARWLGEHREWLRTRVIQGKICDGHGDIRAESICVTNGMCIFDCIEFNERLYFDLAARYASPLRRPTVIAVMGLPGSGKTGIARAIGGELGLRVISSDAVRKTIFEITERYEYGEGPYGAEANRLTYQKLAECGRDLLDQDGGVVLDATFRREAGRASAREMALKSGAQWRVIECRLTPELVRERLERRAKLKEGLSDATWETYHRQRVEFERFDDRDSPRFELDTSADLGVVAHKATDWLRGSDQ